MRKAVIVLMASIFLLSTGCKIFKPCDCPKFGKSAKSVNIKK